MTQDIKLLSLVLSEHNIRPSYQRLRIFKYLSNHPTHPTVETIFNDLIGEIPSLSKMTVYNSLNSFIDAGLVRAMTIENNEVRYDAIMHEHGHFKCDNCGKIYNFEFHFPSEVAGLDHFRIKDRQIYFKGFCKECLETNTFQ